MNSDLCGSNGTPVQSYSRPATGTGTSMDDLLTDQDIESIMNWTRTSHVDDTVGLAAEMDLPNPSLVLDLLHPTSGNDGTVQRKDSNSSQYTPSVLSSFSDHSGHARSSSNASLEDWTKSSSYSQNPSLEQSAGTSNRLCLPPFQPPQQHHRFSLPEMNFDVRMMDQSNTCFASSVSHSPSLPQSLSPLQDIPEGVQMEVHSSMPSIHLQGSSLDFDHLYNYRTGSPIPSSPSVASTSSPSTVHERLFDSGESPSVIELCEMLGETSNVHHRDFSHLTLTGQLHPCVLLTPHNEHAGFHTEGGGLEIPPPPPPPPPEILKLSMVCGAINISNLILHVRHKCVYCLETLSQTASEAI